MSECVCVCVCVILTQVQGVCVGPVGEGGALVDLVQQLLLHLGDGVTIQHFGGQRLALVLCSTLHQDVQGLGGTKGEWGETGNNTL